MYKAAKRFHQAAALKKLLNIWQGNLKKGAGRIEQERVFKTSRKA